MLLPFNCSLQGLLAVSGQHASVKGED